MNRQAGLTNQIALHRLLRMKPVRDEQRKACLVGYHQIQSELAFRCCEAEAFRMTYGYRLRTRSSRRSRHRVPVLRPTAQTDHSGQK